MKTWLQMMLLLVLAGCQTSAPVLEYPTGTAPRIKIPAPAWQTITDPSEGR